MTDHKPCDPADPCATAYDLASERNTLDGLWAETKDRLDAALAQVARLREALAAIVARSETGELGTSRTRDMAHLARAALAETADTPAVQPDPTPDPTVGSDYACDHQQPEDHWPPAAYASPGLRARLDC